MVAGIEVGTQFVGVRRQDSTYRINYWLYSLSARALRYEGEPTHTVVSTSGCASKKIFKNKNTGSEYSNFVECEFASYLLVIQYII